jgi:formylglycine-generating enzyme required for sulfatase activity
MECFMKKGALLLLALPLAVGAIYLAWRNALDPAPPLVLDTRAERVLQVRRQPTDLTPLPQWEGAPPGLVSIQGGRARLGVSKEDIETLLSIDPTARDVLRALDAETGGEDKAVDSFYLGRYEVTGEQYAEFIKAKGHRPPRNWGEAAITTARNAHLSNPQQRGIAFDPAKWWSKNWKESAWAVPKDDLLRPVHYVAYTDVTSYCDWAGLRLPNEREFQHACRRGNDAYPWGSDWREGHCATIENSPALMPVGSFENGRSRDGVYDLLGSLWEWTSSPYLPYSRFERNSYWIEDTQLNPVTMWDGNQRVLVGGSYHNSRLAARATTRRPTEQFQMTETVGFRVAASTRPALDRARRVIASAAGRVSTFAPEFVVGLDRWEYLGTQPASDPPDGYRVITGYRHLFFVPIDCVAVDSIDLLRAESRAHTTTLGLFSTSERLPEPGLEPGVYVVGYSAGDTEEQDAIRFVSVNDGAVITTSLARAARIGASKAGGAWGTIQAGGRTWLALDICSPTATEGLSLSARIHFAAGVDLLDTRWRQ